MSLVPDKPSFFMLICYYASWINIITALPIFIVAVIFEMHPPFENTLIVFRIIVGAGSFTLWIFCLFFYYKNDRYSSAGLWLYIFNIFYGVYYFRSVIWQRERGLKNSFKEEPVLGNKIETESEEQPETGNREPETNP